MAALRIVRRSQAVGRSPISAHGYMVYATLLAAGLGSIDAAIEYGQLALGMAAADNSIGFQAGLRLAWLSALSHSVTSLAETLAPLRECSRQALAAGNITAGIIAALIYVQHATTAMSHYDALHEDLLRSGDGVAWQGLDALRLDYLLELQFLENMRGRSVDPIQLTGSYWDERSMQGNRSDDNTAFLASYSVLKAYLAYLHQDYTLALRHADAARPILSSYTFLHAYPASLTFDSWIRLAVARLRPRGGAGSCYGK